MKSVYKCALTAMLLLAVLNTGWAETFSNDVSFMKEHVEVIVLGSEDSSAQVALIPEYQGRVMTSTAAGGTGMSFGWINRELIASGEIQKHINVYGGEDRFWLGPEGGQYSIFFSEGAEFNLNDWQTPPLIDTEPFEVESVSDDEAVFTRDAQITNYSGTEFNIGIKRTIRLISERRAAKVLSIKWPNDVQVVAYESDNQLINTGDSAWKKESGLLSIWILGMFNPSAGTTVVIPYKEGTENLLGPIVNDEYFGKVPAERLVVKDGAIYFSGDGQYRSKIGLTPYRATDLAGSFDAENGVLTLVKYNKPANATDYVNSMWELQDKPYAGDVINSYNDGPPAPGKKPLGPFYELETSSPAAALAPGETLTHIHQTFHVQGTEEALNEVAQKTLGVGLDDIISVFGG